MRRAVDQQLVLPFAPAGSVVRYRVRVSSGGALEMLETDLCKRLDDNLFAYLTKSNSVPAFLATLTPGLVTQYALRRSYTIYYKRPFPRQKKPHSLVIRVLQA